MAPGEELELTIENLVAECADQGSPVAPREVALVWRQGTEGRTLATIRTNDGRRFTLLVGAPSSALEGPATIEIGDLVSVEITVEQPS